MTTLQASLIFKPLPSPLFQFSSSKPFYSLRLSTTTAFTSLKPRFCRHNLLLHCTLTPDNVNSDFALSNNNDTEIEPREFNEPSSFGESSSSIQEAGNVVESEVLVEENEEMKRKLPIVVFLMGLFAKVKNGFEKILLSDWFSWWPFWQQEKRLDRLIADADANPKDTALQSALLVELNKHRYSFTSPRKDLAFILVLSYASVT